MQKRRVRVTIETERVLVISRIKDTFNDWCPSCNELVRLLRPEEAAVMTACMRASNQSLEIDKLHVIPNHAGMMNICLNSVLTQA